MNFDDLALLAQRYNVSLAAADVGVSTKLPAGRLKLLDMVEESGKLATV